ncbi:MAG: hypothetical protein ROR55_12375 [Devosia sp.]
MLRDTIDREPERLLPAGERDAWRSTRGFGHSPSEEEAEQPAPWHQPYEEPRTAAKDYRRRPTVTRPAPRNSATEENAGAKDFVSLAQTIETMRRERAAQNARIERARERPAPPSRPAPAARPAIASSHAMAPRPAVAPVPERHPTAVAHPESLAGDNALITDLVRSVSRTADKADVARLEDILSHVLKCLRALEDARSPEARTPQQLTDTPEPDARPGTRSTRSASPRRLWT